MAMRITHLNLTNWRNFKTVDAPFARRMFIVGPNASGKSNLLDEVLVLSPTPDGTTAELASQMDGVRNSLDIGMTLEETLDPLTKPPRVGQLSLLS